MFHIDALMTSPLGVSRSGLQSLLQLDRHTIHVHGDPPLNGDIHPADTSSDNHLAG
jgi:hypothetical protein